MKAIRLMLPMLMGCAVLAGCSGATKAPGTASPAPTAVIMPAETIPSGTANHEPEEEFEAEQPPRTPWPEPQNVDYAGPWLTVAQDGEPAKYPNLTLSSEPVETTWGSLRLPAGWTVKDADGFEPVFMDEKGRAVGAIYPIHSFSTEPYFALLQDDQELILWETPDYAVEARRLTTVADAPAADSDDRKAIVRQISFITEGPLFDDSDLPYYMATCLVFDKAYLNGEDVEYVISNKVIDEIAKSFAQSLEE